MSRTYWLDLFSVETWNEFLAAGGNTSGFSERRWATVSQIKPGDYLLCYLVGGISRWIGVLEVTSPAFIDHTPIWRSQVFPARVKVRVVTQLTPETGVPVLAMRNELSVFRDLRNPNIWSGRFRGSPNRWSMADGEKVANAIMNAATSPTVRALTESQLKGPPPELAESDIGPVAIPEKPDALEQPPERERTAHTEIQSLLAELGRGVGLDVWIPREDRHRHVAGGEPSRINGIRDKLPPQFDALMASAIEHIDVLWLERTSIVAAFEIESTTSVYSGILRMSDLVALQPNLQIPLYIVAPDERRVKVMQEINRPTFKKLNLPDVCQYISFGRLRSELEAAGKHLSYLRRDFLDFIAEPCEGTSSD